MEDSVSVAIAPTFRRVVPRDGVLKVQLDLFRILDRDGSYGSNGNADSFATLQLDRPNLALDAHTASMKVLEDNSQKTGGTELFDVRLQL